MHSSDVGCFVQLLPRMRLVQYCVLYSHSIIECELNLQCFRTGGNGVENIRGMRSDESYSASDQLDAMIRSHSFYRATVLVLEVTEWRSLL